MENTALFCSDCPWDSANTKDCIVRCKRALGRGGCNRLNCLKGIAGGHFAGTNDCGG